ncbi:hypothetical protein MNBD_ALPHA01-2075 [hydrothermal vent metagenome]|uniref:Lipoprotein n=1 Tax=hydrothermal vent metagenome TaxID=652676 RepID=A0A3B0S7S9_9ZZZZ
MQKFIMVFFMGVLCLGLASCGKRGDLRPPAGYEEPVDNRK